MAIRMGKHVYCQKPLTQTIYEARLLRQLAEEYKVATQMGNQGSAEDGLRRAVEVVQAGFIGPVRQVYVWSNRPIWPQGMDRPAGQDPVPATLDWDLWLGPAPWRPFKWSRGTRGRDRPKARQGPAPGGACIIRSTGAAGRISAPARWATWPAIRSTCPSARSSSATRWRSRPSASPINKESYPLKSKIRFEFPAREGLPPVTFWWFDGGNPKPDNPYRA